MNILKQKSFVAIAFVMSLVMFATPILAQQGEIMAGRMAGEQAARANTNGMLWMAIGCVGSWIGILAAYIYAPSPPTTQLLGKSPEYVAAYTDAYKETAKKVQTGKVWTGCITSAVLYTVFYVVLFATAAATTTDTVY